MEQFSGFFDGILIGVDDDGYDIYDREFNSEDFSYLIGSFFGNGVYPNPSTGLQVLAHPDMQIKVLTGEGLINGRYYRLKSDLTMKIVDSDVSLNRIDRVVLRFDLDKREIALNVLEGIPSSKPVPPILTRDTRTYELCLAEITITANSKEITQTQIRDTRHISELCGIVAAAVENVDVSNLYIQYEEDLKNKIDMLNAILESGDVAGELLKVISEYQKETEVLLKDKQDRILKDEKNGAKYETTVINGRPYFRVVEV